MTNRNSFKSQSEESIRGNMVKKEDVGAVINKDVHPHMCLFRPLIPQNTGNISRTCAATGTPLHLVKPLGFSLDESKLRRAGLDYWPSVKLSVHDSLEEVADEFGWDKFVFLSGRGTVDLWEYDFPDAPVLVMGAETTGLPADILERFKEQTVRIPINRCVRSLNLSTSAGVALYTALWKLGLTSGISSQGVYSEDHLCSRARRRVDD